MTRYYIVREPFRDVTYKISDHETALLIQGQIAKDTKVLIPLTEEDD